MTEESIENLVGFKGESEWIEFKIIVKNQTFITINANSLYAVV